VAFAGTKSLNPYVKPTLQQLFDFVKFYTDYYKTGAGKNHPDAAKRWKNAERVRFNIETKINPRQDRDFNGIKYSDRTVDAKTFAKAVADVIVANGLQERADIQSFDFRTLLEVQEKYPQIRTVYLFTDGPIFRDPTIAGSGDGTNLQDENGKSSPWLAGMYWPYRSTTLSNPFRAQRSGGFEGMALTTDLAPTILELAGAPALPGIDGRSLLPLFTRTPADWRKSFLIEYTTDIVFPRMLKMGYDAVRNDRYKYIRYRQLEGMNELYDLQQDPYELRNLIDSKSSTDLRRRMEAELNALLSARPPARK